MAVETLITVAFFIGVSTHLHVRPQTRIQMYLHEDLDSNLAIHPWKLLCLWYSSKSSHQQTRIQLLLHEGFETDMALWKLLCIHSCRWHLPRV